MLSAAEMSRRLQPLTNLQTLQKIVEKEVVKNESELVDYKKGDLLIGDIYGDGSRVPYRFNEYAEIKYFRNPMAGGEVDLIYNGDFIKSFFLSNTDNGSYLFDAKDWKRNLLVKKYSSDIFGMNQKKFNRFIDFYVKDEFIKEIKRRLNG